MKILVVDDDEIAVAIARKVLSSDGHEVVCAADGVEALQILQEIIFQVVISDWSMPTWMELNSAGRIRQAASIGYIYIIMITSRRQ